MILNTSGTRTFTGGTMAFGSNPGVFFAGSASANTMVNSAITGSAGLINTNATLTLAGDLSGLTGTISTNSGCAVTTLVTNTFSGTLAVRWGQLNLNVSQTLAGQGPILLGAPENDDHLVNNFTSVNFAGAGANAIIGRDIVVDQGSFDAAGIQTTFGFLPVLAPLSNSTGSQTLSGNITLNSPPRLQGGGGGGTRLDDFEREHFRPRAILSQQRPRPIYRQLRQRRWIPRGRTRIHRPGVIPGHSHRLSAD